jgi:hypothetical protein
MQQYVLHVAFMVHDSVSKKKMLLDNLCVTYHLFRNTTEPIIYYI